jgi:hypothetical protein
VACSPHTIAVISSQAILWGKMEVSLGLYSISIQFLCVMEILKHCITNTMKALSNISEQTDFFMGRRC